MRILKSHPLLKRVNSFSIDSPEPSNISYFWNFGSLLGLCLIIQIVTPSLRGQLFSYAILGFAFAEATGLFALMMAFLLYVA